MGTTTARTGAIYAHTTTVGTTEPLLVVNAEARVRFVNELSQWDPSTATVRPGRAGDGSSTILGIAGDRTALVEHADTLRTLRLDDLIGQSMFTPRLPRFCWLVAVTEEQLGDLWPEQGLEPIVDSPARERGRRSSVG